MINILYETLIFSGLIIFAVLYYQKKISTNFLKALTEIIKTNEINEYDPLKFVETLPPIMEKLGVRAYSYYIYYRDCEYQRNASHSRSSIKKFVCDLDFTVYVEISPGKLKWEKAHLGQLLTEIIFLLIKVDVTLNMKATTKALTEFSKINTFLSHDIKNLAQFIGIMEHNLDHVTTDEQRDKLLGYLRSTAPALKMRADRVLMALTESAREFMPAKESVVPSETARSIASILNVLVECDDTGESYLMDRKGVIIIFENIIKNFYDKSIVEPGIRLAMSTRMAEGYITITFSDTGSLIPNTDRIFEPFYSEKSGGLGIGLYHCRNIANNMNGRLWAENSAAGPKFILRIKCMQ